MDQESSLQSNLIDEEIYLEHERLHSPRLNTTAISRAASASPCHSPAHSPRIVSGFSDYNHNHKNSHSRDKDKERRRTDKNKSKRRSRLNEQIQSDDLGSSSAKITENGSSDIENVTGNTPRNISGDSCDINETFADSSSSSCGEISEDELERPLNTTLKSTTTANPTKSAKNQQTARANSNVILCALATIAFGQALLLTTNIDVMTTLICDDHFHRTVGSLWSGLSRPDPVCRTPEVAAIVADFAAKRQMIAGSLSIVVIPRLAELSDRYGRRPLMVLVATSIILAEAISLMCMLFPNIFHYRWLLFVSVIQGCGGSLGTLQLLNSSYVVDVVPSKDRGKFLGRLDSVFFACIALAPLVGSLILSVYHSLVLLYCISLCCAAVFWLITFFYLIESRSLKERRLSQALHNESQTAYLREHARTRHALRHHPSHVKLLHSSKQIAHQYLNVFKPLKLLSFNHIGDKKRKRNARVLTVISAITAELGIAVAAVVLLYGETRFQWTAVQTGYLMALTGVTRSFLLAVIYPIIVAYLVKRLGFNTTNVDRTDALLLRIGLFVQVTGYLFVFKADTGIGFGGALIYECFGALTIPTIKSGLVKYADNGRLGELFGALSLVNSIGSVVVPILFLQIYKYTVASVPGMVFLIASCGLVVVFTTTFLLRPDTRGDLEQECECGTEGSSSTASESGGESSERDCLSRDSSASYGAV